MRYNPLLNLKNLISTSIEVVLFIFYIKPKKNSSHHLLVVNQILGYPPGLLLIFKLSLL